MKTMCIILCFPFLLAGCNKLFPDDELSLQRIPYTGKELRTDGYYYRKVQNYKEELLNIHFFYSNGVVRYAGCGSTSFEEVEECILNNQINLGISRTTWGYFKLMKMPLSLRCGIHH